MVSDPALALLARHIRDVPDFPKPGILFKDITPLLADATAFRLVLHLLAERLAPLKPTMIVGVESRGFIFAAPVAERLGLGFAPVRKPGKLPYRRVTETYDLEYGSGTLEMHEDAVAGQRVVIIDDVLATGGTAAGSARLCQKQGAEVVGYGFVLELSFLHGRKALGGHPAVTLLSY
ncbi:MAG TPA: adenine phosphoribosyltransferase [Pseudomonadota bacterium]|nr:adenine phosphoribosyltransferase [Pseudomonadota bacterium]